MLQCLFNCHSLGWIKNQGLPEKANRLWIAVVEKRLKRSVSFYCYWVNDLGGTLWFDGHQINIVWFPQQLKNQLDLVQTRFPRKEWSASEELSQNTADRPHINCLWVFIGAQNNLRCSVPTRGDILGHYLLLLLLSLNWSSQSKIPYLNQTLRIY